MSWPKERREELASLIRLLDDAQSLDSANRTIERMRRLVDRAEALTSSNIGSPTAAEFRVSFVEFLKEEATK